MIGALLYLVIFALACAPGLPLGWRLFGRSPAGWISGALIGYALTAFAIWLVIAIHAASGAAFVLAWAALLGVSWLLLGVRSSALVALPAWDARAARAWAFVLLLTSVVAIPPLANVGATDGEGNKYYRAYFTADFVWHMALTAEIGKFSMPPRDPFLASRPIHYYWTYYLLPAAVSTTGPQPVHDVQRSLAVNAYATGLLLMSAVFIAAFAAVGRAWPAAAGAALALVASSAEGLATLAGALYRGLPLATLRDVNIDAMSAWVLRAHRIDGLQRCLWYVPQHSMAYALGLIALAAVTLRGSDPRGGPTGAILLGGIALACSAAMNPFVGGMFALAYGVAVAVDAWRRPSPIACIGVHALTAVPVVLVLLWSMENQMVEGAGGALQIGFSGASRHWPIASLLLSLGPMLLIGAAGLRPSGSVPLGRVTPFVTLAVISLFLLYFVQLSVDDSWIGFRAGQMMLVALAVLAARFIASAGTRLAAAAIVAVLLAGAPTTAIDEYNARDIRNESMSPGGFPWTIVVSVPQQHALSWIRANTPRDAVVQMDPTIRERSTWSLIPSFAERRMAAGLPISLLNIPEYAARSEMVRTMYDTPSAAQARDIARRLRIHYVYVDNVERAAHPTVSKFDANPEYFDRVFIEGDAAVYRVK